MKRTLKMQAGNREKRVSFVALRENFAYPPAVVPFTNQYNGQTPVKRNYKTLHPQRAVFSRISFAQLW